MALSSRSSRVSSQNRKIQDVPNVPVIGTPIVSVREDRSVDVPFTIPTPITGGIADQYRAISTPGNFQGVSPGSPVTVQGLTGGTSYTFQVRAETSTGANNGLTAASSTIVPEFGAMEAIATTTAEGLGGVTFLNIPQNYQDLFLVSNMFIGGVNSGSSYTGLAFNNDRAGNYSVTQISGNGSSAFTQRGTNNNQIFNSTTFESGVAFGSSAPFTTIWHILNYKNSTTNKTVLYRTANDRNGSGQTIVASALHRSTSPISRIDINIDNGSMVLTNSQFSLYGVRASI
jgi:hypothetical protein